MNDDRSNFLLHDFDPSNVTRCIACWSMHSTIDRQPVVTRVREDHRPVLELCVSAYKFCASVVFHGLFPVIDNDDSMIPWLMLNVGNRCSAKEILHLHSWNKWNRFTIKNGFSERLLQCTVFEFEMDLLRDITDLHYSFHSSSLNMSCLSSAEWRCSPIIGRWNTRKHVRTNALTSLSFFIVIISSTLNSFSH